MALDKDSIRSQVQQIVHDALQTQGIVPVNISPTAPLVDLGIDSKSVMELWFGIEKGFNLSVHEDTISTLLNVESIVEYINSASV